MSELSLQPCPFCGGEATIQPWHGGRPTKKLISCSNGDYEDEDGGCSVGPSVSGQTEEEAAVRWNRRLIPVELVEAASELAQYSSYAEIVGGVSLNRSPIRKWCDEVFRLHGQFADARDRAEVTSIPVVNLEGGA